MSLRTASFFASYTAGILDSPASKVQEETYQVTLSKTSTSEQFGIYSWDFTYIDDTFGSIVDEIGTSSGITKIQLSFRYNNNVDGIKILVRKYDGDDPKLETVADVLANASIADLQEVDLLQTNQTAIIIDLDDVGNFYYDTFLKIAQRLSINVVMIRDPILTSSGSVDISGQTLYGETSEWRDTLPTEAVDAPLLIVTYEVAEEAHPILNMRYTGLDPTANQTTSAASTGSYIALNNIYASGDIASSINSIQTTIPINSASNLPDTVGLASVGPEIFKYTSMNTSDKKLTGVIRGIAPPFSFPAGFDSFKIAEKVHYLNDLTQLFDTRPSSGLVQYRCIAITNDDGKSDLSIKEASIGIAQDADANVQIRIGVEVPAFDMVNGITGSGTTTTLLTGTGISKVDGFYDGAGIKLLSPTEYAIVDTYTSDGEFVLDRTITGLASGRNFVILPAPAQQIPNDATAPTLNNGRFGGFSEYAEGISVVLGDHGTTMQELDLFYVWIRRTLKLNVEETNNTGAVLIFRYRDI